MLSIAGDNAAKIPLTERAGYEKQLFGTQGFGGFALLADPAVKQQIASLMKDMNSSEFKNRYASFMEDYSAGSPVQAARQSWADLQNVLMDLGSTVLPGVTRGLKGVDEVLTGIQALFGSAGAFQRLNDDQKTALKGITDGLDAFVGRLRGIGAAISGFFGGGGPGAAAPFPPATQCTQAAWVRNRHSIRTSPKPTRPSISRRRSISTAGLSGRRSPPNSRSFRHSQDRLHLATPILDGPRLTTISGQDRKMMKHLLLLIFAAMLAASSPAAAGSLTLGVPDTGRQVLSSKRPGRHLRAVWVSGGHFDGFRTTQSVVLDARIPAGLQRSRASPWVNDLYRNCFLLLWRPTQ